MDRKTGNRTFIMRRLPVVFVVVGVLLALVSPQAAAPTFADAAQPIDLTAPAVPGEFLVKFKAGTARQARGAAVRAQGGHVFDRIDALDVEAVEFPALKSNRSRQATEAIVDALQRNPNVEYVEPNYLYAADFVPNDPDAGLRSRQYAAWRNVHAYVAWDVTRGSTSTIIAIVDTGVRTNHPDLAGKLVAGYDFVDNDNNADDGHGHGTHVAGTAAARTNNRVGGAGMCPNCRLLPVRVLGNNGRGTTANIAKGINYAANRGARVINLSLGGTSGSSTLQNAVNYAWNKGAFLACAAGNNNSSSPIYPAVYGNCFAVASTTSADTRSSFSNFGNWVEVAAPGSGIYSTVPTGTCALCAPSGYRTLNGTSMAAPHVAGLAGLLRTYGLTNAQLRDAICYSSDAIAGTGSLWGCGRINAVQAVAAYATPAPGDFDGDGKADLSIKTPDGRWLIDFAANGLGETADRTRGWDRVYVAYGGDDAHPVPADYDGDGKTDLSVKTDDTKWYIDYASDGFGSWNASHNGYGWADAHPVPVDYDGDGKADLSVKTDAGWWHIDLASDGFGAWNVNLSAYGGSEAEPAPADYDGDGKADLSVKATDTGRWWLDFASDGFGSWNTFFPFYGGGEAHPVPADYDGDGKADLSVKTDGGDWMIDYAAGGFGAWNLIVSAYGGPEAYPVPADYDGDGKADLSIKTNYNGQWMIDYAADGFNGWNRILY